MTNVGVIEENNLEDTSPKNAKNGGERSTRCGKRWEASWGKETGIRTEGGVGKASASTFQPGRAIRRSRILWETRYSPMQYSLFRGEGVLNKVHSHSPSFLYLPSLSFPFFFFSFLFPFPPFFLTVFMTYSGNAVCWPLLSSDRAIWVV